MNNVKNKMILRYAQIVAKGDNATEQDKLEQKTIEDQLHLAKDSILREATKLGLAQIK